MSWIVGVLDCLSWQMKERTALALCSMCCLLRAALQPAESEGCPMPDVLAVPDSRMSTAAVLS
jgi:hypothetical protein